MALNVLVVGGGIGGLAAAIALSRKGHGVTVIERDPDWSVYGVGIIQQSNVVRAMEQLGVLDRFISAAFGFDAVEIYAPDGTRVARIPSPRLVEGRPANVGIGRPALQAVLADTALAKIGMTVCYDVRFPHLYRRLAKAGAQIITVPAAFNHITGAAHWETLLRARAIETGCFVLAPAQTGFHPEAHGKGRRTHGHSLAIAPWGEVLADAGTEAGVTLVDIDLGRVETARARVPSLSHDREFDGP